MRVSVTGNRRSFCRTLKKLQKTTPKTENMLHMLLIAAELKKTWESGIFWWGTLRSEFSAKLEQQGHAGSDAAIILSSLQTPRAFIWLVGWVGELFVGALVFLFVWFLCFGRVWWVFFPFSCSVNPDSKDERSEEFRTKDTEEIRYCVRFSVQHWITNLNYEIMLLPTFLLSKI